jgi:hypothetical protein
MHHFWLAAQSYLFRQECKRKVTASSDLGDLAEAE